MPKVTITKSAGLFQETGSTNITLADDVLAGTLKKVITLTDADKDLTAADSGAIIKCATGLTGARTVTLPATAGANFVVHVVDTGANLNFEAGTLECVGTIIDAAAEVTSADATKSIFRVEDNAGVGDSFTLVCDGVQYVVAGTAKDATKFSFQT